MMLIDRMTVTLAIAGSSLVLACADDGDDSGLTAAATMDGSDTAGSDTAGTDETTSTDESTTAPDADTGGTSSEAGSDTGGGCDPMTDPCVVDADCPDAGATCVECLCMADEDACNPGACDTCPTQSECAFCSQVAEAECGPQNLACNMNTVCQTILQCQLDCGGDQPCEDQCVTDNPDGEADYSALIECILMVCA